MIQIEYLFASLMDFVWKLTLQNVDACSALPLCCLSLLLPVDNPGANRWFLQSTPIQMLPPEGSICWRLTRDLPLGCLQDGSAPFAGIPCRSRVVGLGSRVWNLELEVWGLCLGFGVRV